MIPVSRFFDIQTLTDYKLHAARSNEYKEQPLDAFVRDRERWRSWNRYYKKNRKNDFNRRYIFSMMQFYHSGKDIWLFGGIFEVKGRDITKEEDSYNSVLTDIGKNLIGRLKIKVSVKARGRAYCLENFWDKMSVYEFMPEPYTGEKFPGYDNISLTFLQLEEIINNLRKDWKTALESVKGIYCITDSQNGRKYIGSASGETGIWSRWAQYIDTGHGGNKKLRHELSLNEAGKKVFKKGIDYAREHFHFCLLECFPFKIEDKKIIERENFWKKALLTRGEFGYNAN